MARRKDGQMNSSTLVVNPGSSQTGMANAPHPESGRQKGLSPKTGKDKNTSKFSKQSGGLTSQIGTLPLNLQQQHSSGGGYSNKS